MDILDSSGDRGVSALSEFESKKLLASYGIPICKELLALSQKEALSAAEKLGYPVALKACSPRLMHKSEAGVIALGIGGPDELGRAYGQIVEKSPVELDGVLVQEMVVGRREMVLGLSRDPSFGPCVMLGLGGVFAEVLKDTVFRAAPPSRADARDMTEELKSRDMLGAFRGEAAVDLDTLCESLIALGNIGLELDQVMEIDVNPMIIGPAGKLTAVDALVVLKEAAK